MLQCLTIIVVAGLRTPRDLPADLCKIRVFSIIDYNSGDEMNIVITIIAHHATVPANFTSIGFTSIIERAKVCRLISSCRRMTVKRIANEYSNAGKSWLTTAYNSYPSVYALQALCEPQAADEFAVHKRIEFASALCVLVRRCLVSSLQTTIVITFCYLAIPNKNPYKPYIFMKQLSRRVYRITSKTNNIQYCPTR